MSQIVIGVDIGTGGCKTIASDVNGRIIAEAFEEYSVYHPQMNWAEQDPEEWWKAARITLKQITSKISSDRIIGVGLTSQREAFAPLDKAGEKLYNSIIWLDMRAVLQKNKIEKLIPPRRVLEITGVPVDHIFSAAKILWIKDNLPDVFRKINRILFAKDYIAFKLCNVKSTDRSMASRTMLFDVHRLQWSHEICESLEIPVDILPEVKGSWEVVGEVDSRASEQTGLPVGVPVVSGGGDRPCEALGAGTYREGDVNIGTGTGTVFEVPVSKPKPDPRGLIDCCCHVVPDTWEYEIIINATGESLRWFRDNFGHEEVYKAREEGVSPYILFDRMAAEVPPGAGGLFYYPYLWGARAPKFDLLARSAFIGFTHAHKRPAFIKSILEGVAFQYSETLQLVRELGVDIKRITMTGGEVKSNLWNQIKADVLGMYIHVPEVLDAAALGSCILASIGAKAYADFETAVKHMIRISKTYNPNPKAHSEYAKLLKAYQKVYEYYEQCFKILADISG
ncbi:xylulokinase [Candidatus Bathyarchaeota archaeon]|nr:xylulokinase [Candidatus Bathyarchaeota archaeon]MBS7612635.1 xylulokinase [Candidatus Bathyarchaeota archaeon]MBS7617218.1 xylulokinase [Candidatus Bathyarchaeota archaeon]